ncbi:MAG: metal ABC transporter substrate-binding protein [Spirochaetota bacterium]
MVKKIAAAAFAIICCSCDMKRNAHADILTSFFPMQIFALNVTAGTDILPLLLLPPELGCPHDYALTPGDVERLSTAKAVIINGTMESFITPEKMKAVNPLLRIIDVSKDVTLLRDDGDAHEGHAGGYNPHTWVSPRIAAGQVRAMGRSLAVLYPEKAALLYANADRYAKRLDLLAAEMRSSFAALPSRDIITFHDAFAYFARDLGLSVVGVVELDPGTSPSAKHIMGIAALARRHGVRTIFAEVQYPDAVARAVAAEANARILILDPVASGKNASPGYYEAVMQRNAAVITEAMRGQK